MLNFAGGDLYWDLPKKLQPDLSSDATSNRFCQITSMVQWC